jgi:hypothetical protein
MRGVSVRAIFVGEATRHAEAKPYCGDGPRRSVQACSPAGMFNTGDPGAESSRTPLCACAMFIPSGGRE